MLKPVLLLSALVSLGAGLVPGAELPARVWQVARPRPLVPGAPKYSDVSMRSLRPHPARWNDPHDTLRAAQELHLTRLEWTYGLDRDFVTKAKALGLLVGGALEDESPDANGSRLLGRVTGEDGRLKKHKWFPEGRWVGCANAPEFMEATSRQARLFIDAGVDVMQQDDPTMALHCEPPLCYCKYCRAAFVAYQREHGAQASYEQFQKDSIMAYHRELHRRVDAYAGRHVPFSNNNAIGSHEALGWPTPAFDFVLAETDGKSVHPAEIYKKLAAAGGIPLEFQYRDTSVAHNRRGLAAFYAVGMSMLLPWDVYLTTGGRYFGKTEDYADLSGFIRANAQYLDGYEEAAAAGKGIGETRYGARAPLRLEGGSGEAYAFARARPGQTNAPVVIHLVEWATNAQAFTLSLHTENFTDRQHLRARLRVPATYEPALHQKAQESGDFSPLATETSPPTRQAGDYTVVQLPALRPWGILVVEP